VYLLGVITRTANKSTYDEHSCKIIPNKRLADACASYDTMHNSPKKKGQDKIYKINMHQQYPTPHSLPCMLQREKVYFFFQKYEQVRKEIDASKRITQP
jgi:hypothetical protein